MSSSRTRSRTEVIWDAAKIVLAIVLMGFVLSQTSIDELVSVARRASLAWLALGILAFCAGTCFMTIRYRILIGQQISLPRLLGVVIVQIAITNFVASGLGAASYIALLRGEHQVKAGWGVASLLSSKVGDLVVFSLTLATASFIVWGRVDALHEVVILLLVGMTLVLMLLFLIILTRRQLAALTRHIQARLAEKRMARVEKMLDWPIMLMSAEPSKMFPILAPLVFYSLLGFVCSSLWVFCILESFDVSLGIWPVVFVVSLTQLMSIIPIQVFGGLGVFEITTIYLLGLFGIGPPKAAALAVSLRIILSMLSLLLLLYLPVASWVERRISHHAQSAEPKAKT